MQVENTRNHSSIVLVGNQNCGKTTLFNYMTKSNQYVGNWPGVTLDRVCGEAVEQGLKVFDLPGLYSLSPYSIEEVVSRDFLMEGNYDVIVNLVDATHLERSLSLTTELLSFKQPMVVAVNMIDLANKAGIELDLAKLEEIYNLRFVPICAANGEGVDELYKAIQDAKVSLTMPYQEKVLDSLKRISDKIDSVLNNSLSFESKSPSLASSQCEDCKCDGCLKSSNESAISFVALSLLQDDKRYLEQFSKKEDLLILVNKEQLSLQQEYNCDIESLIAQQRYAFIDKVIKETVKKHSESLNQFSQKIDNIVTNKYLALPIFALVVYLVYYLAVSTIGTMGTDYANDVLFGEYATNAASSLLTSVEAPEWLSGLVVDGIIGGVGAVLGFVPQMIVLFILLSLLEQSGYMTRVAFVLDRIFRHFGLSGRCFIPMIVATGCGVPAIMASNGIDNINEKRLTIITTTFMPCSAKLPILAMIAASFFPESTLIAPGIYFLAIFAVLFTAFVLKKDSAFKEEVSPFVLEMPNYSMPKLGNVIRSTYERCRAFVLKAGTVIFTTVVLIWFLSSFNFVDGSFVMVEVNDSILAAIGSAIAFIFIPLGFASWQASVSIFTGLLAKENVVGTLAVLLGLGEVAEDDPSLSAALNGEFTTSSAALAFLVFNLFSTPCIAALGAMKRQLNNGKFFAFAVAYMLVFAYALALVIYQLGGLITGELAFNTGSVIALVLVAVAIFFVVRPEKKNRPSLKIPVKQI